MTFGEIVTFADELVKSNWHRHRGTGEVIFGYIDEDAGVMMSFLTLSAVVPVEARAMILQHAVDGRFFQLGVPRFEMMAGAI